MTEKSFDTIVSVLINSKIKAENYNRDGINDAYIESINSALSELKEMKILKKLNKLQLNAQKVSLMDIRKL